MGWKRLVRGPGGINKGSAVKIYHSDPQDLDSIKYDDCLYVAIFTFRERLAGNLFLVSSTVATTATITRGAI